MNTQNNTKTLCLATMEAEFRSELEDASLSATRARDTTEEGDRILGGWVNISDITLPSGVMIKTGWWIHCEERNEHGQHVDLEAQPYPGSGSDDGCEYSLANADSYEWADGEQDEWERDIRDMVERVLDEQEHLATACYLDEVLRPLVERRIAKARAEQDEAIESADSWDELKDAAKVAGVEI